jgi:hypothetical protein
MLDDIKIAYDPTVLLQADALYVDGDATHNRTAFLLTRGNISSTILDVGAQSSNFRDAVINYLLEQSSRNDIEIALRTLSTVISSLDDGDPRLLGYSEYAAVFATVLGEKTIAAKIIKRNNMSTASNFLKSIAMAISKSMPGNAFNELIQNSTRNAVDTWTQLERPVLYPNN